MKTTNRLAFLSVLAISLVATLAYAEPESEPTDTLLFRLKESMVKVVTTTKTGGHGFGTGVAVSKDHIVTNCHVVNHASGISVSKWGVEYAPVGLQADWKHDLCILKFEWADFKPIQMAQDDNMQYEQPVISISMPSDSPAPYVEFSTIKALYAMDDGEVIRTKAAFAIGASGSPLFDKEGHLVGISTFKSPGKHAYFYNMPVKWVRALLQQPASKLNGEHDEPFWDAPEDARPFFMQIVLPFQNDRWQDVQTIATRWTKAEPNSAEAWYYLGRAAQQLQTPQIAKPYFERALALHPNHPASLQALALMAQMQGNAAQVESIRVVLKGIGADALQTLDDALGVVSGSASNEAEPCATC